MLSEPVWTEVGGPGVWGGGSGAGVDGLESTVFRVLQEYARPVKSGAAVENKRPLCTLLTFSLLSFRLRYSGYFGGVTALSREQFFKVNGFSNNYWGWGGEDDDLRLR